MDWRVTAALGTAKTFFPFYNTIRRVKRRISPYVSDSGNDHDVMVYTLRQISILRDAGIDLRGKTIVELGTGWIPTAPLVFSLTGAKVITVDIERLLDRRTFLYAANFVSSNIEKVADETGFEVGALNSTAPYRDANASLEMLLSGNGIEYRAPQDIRALPDRFADVITSTSVLEHIPGPLLADILTHCRRILRPSGMMIHGIDVGDHFAMYDKSISRLNFLQYEDNVWKWTHRCHQLYMNRLRMCEFEELFEECGFEIKNTIPAADEQARRDAQAMQVAQRFAKFSPEELSVLSATIVAG